METPLQRTIRIGKVTVGLLGLDVALNQLNDKDILQETVKLHQSDKYEEMREKIALWNKGKKPAVDVIAENIIQMLQEVA